jgi:hypothetical protein
MQKHLYLAVIVSGVALIGAGTLFRTAIVDAQTEHSAAVFTADGRLEMPTGFRRWVFVSAPLMPNALNNGKANFPKFHHVYIQAQNVYP